MALVGLLFWFLLSLGPPHPSPQGLVAMRKTDLNERFLLQVSYEQVNGLQDFMTSRSRIVHFKRQGSMLRMVEEPHDSGTPPHLLATIPIGSETAHALMVDFNAGFDRIVEEEDRTGEDMTAVPTPTIIRSSDYLNVRY
jgi:hypothetical protein